MAVRKVPPADVMPLTDDGHWTADYYDLIKMLDTLDALSNIVFPPAGVTSIDATPGAFTLGYGISRSSLNLRAGLTSLSAALGADVALNNSGAYFDGPSIAQGGVGTWFVSGSVTLLDITTAPTTVNCRLWDGATVIASSVIRLTAGVGGFQVSLSGIIASPAGNLKISCNQSTATTGKILFNGSGNAKDSVISAVRIA